MEVKVISASDLSPALQQEWRGILEGNDELASPFFAPEYFLAVASVVSNARVGVGFENSKAVAFLPFEKDNLCVGQRLRLCDYQAVIAPKSFDWDIRGFLRGCGLRAWDFDHLLASQAALQSFHRRRVESPIMDLSEGFDAYLAERKASGRMELIKRCQSKMRKLEREAGPVRLEIHRPDETALRQLLAWRGAKYQSRHSDEVLGGILQSVMRVENIHCRGTLSVLHAGEQVVAGHMGVRSASTWHWWVPAYNPQFDKYSPGLIMLLKMAENMAQAGVRIIDFGRGDQDYKTHLKTGAIGLAEGSVEVSPMLAIFRGLKRTARQWVKPRPVPLETLAPAPQGKV